MKHKHAKMIKAKADNMDLVVFVKLTSMWSEMDDRCLIPSDVNFEYFLCLPQHKDTCSHWLNGGDVQYKDKGSFAGITPYNGLIEKIGKAWSDGTIWMQNGNEIRIKPKKEKRWIATCKGWNALQKVFKSREEAVDLLGVDGYQFHEIEVEV